MFRELRLNLEIYNLSGVYINETSSVKEYVLFLEESDWWEKLLSYLVLIVKEKWVRSNLKTLIGSDILNEFLELAERLKCFFSLLMRNEMIPLSLPFGCHVLELNDNLLYLFRGLRERKQSFLTLLF